MSSTEEIERLCDDSLTYVRGQQTADISSFNKGLLAPLYDLIDRGGKRWRPILGMLIAEAHGVDIWRYDGNE